MALTDVSPGGIPEKGVTYSKITSDGSVADIDAIPNDTYFYDLSDDLPYYKTSNGSIIGVYSSYSKNPIKFEATWKESIALDPVRCDIQLITEQKEQLTFNVPSPTAHNGGRFVVRLKDNGISQPVVWNNVFRGIFTDLPSKTVAGETTYLEFIYNETDNKYDLISPYKSTVDIFTARTTGYHTSNASGFEDVAGGVIPLLAGSLATDGSWIDLDIMGETFSDNLTKNIKLTFDGVTIAENTAHTTPNDLAFKIKVKALRYSNAVVKIFTEITFDGIATQSKYTQINSRDFAGTDSTFELTAEALNQRVRVEYITGTITNF